VRRLRSTVFLLCACVALACQGTGGGGLLGRSAASPQLDRILASGVLRVGLSGAQPPLNMRNKAGELIGLEVDLVDALATSMGLETQLVTMPFAALLPALEAGDVDLVVSGMTITPERNARVAFAGPYLASGKSVLAKKGTLKSAALTELDRAGRSYVALEGSTSERFVKDWLPRGTLTPAADYDAAIQLVADGRADALVADYPFCVFTVLRRPEAGFETFTTSFTVEPLGIAVPAGDPLFVNLLENYLQSLEDAGVLTSLRARWLSAGSWLDELP
jgi:polar amino acid transport system substrate-binding protein